MQWDLVIIGAGPAGMSAAIQAKKQGLRVAVVDQQHTPGGQIFRNVGQSETSKCEAIGADYARGKALVAEFSASSVQFMPATTVWHITPEQVYISHQGKSKVLLTRRILIATGGMERPVPIPGWTEPGVLGASAADILLKSASLVPKGPVIVCGNGPLLLQSVVHLRHFDIPIAGVVLTNSFKNMLNSALHFPGALLRPKYLAHGISMGLRTIMEKNIFPAARNPKIQKNGETLRLSFKTCFGKERVVEGTTLLLHEGVIPETRISHLARLKHIWNPRQRCWQVQTDIWGMTDQAGISVAGDCAGVRGADAAMALGQLTALELARQLGKISMQDRDNLATDRRRDMLRYTCMQPFMDAIFSPALGNICPPDETIVCRCEEVSAGTLREIIEKGSYSLDGLKSQARCGMGTCQGRMCSASVAELIAQTHGIPLDQLNQYHAQFPLTPIRLGEIADMHMPPSGL